MTLDTVTLDDARRLLSLPRTLGEIDGEPVTVQNGRYGPYVKKGTDSRSLEDEEQLFTITLAEAKELFAQPKARGRGRAAAAPPLREFACLQLVCNHQRFEQNERNSWRPRDPGKTPQFERPGLVRSSGAC